MSTSPRSLPARIHSAAHPSCWAGESAGITCDLLDKIKAAVEQTSAHVCSYCAETLPVSLDESTNLTTARAHMAKCEKHPMHELLEAARGVQCACSIAQRDSGHLVDCGMPALIEAIAKAEGR